MIQITSLKVLFVRVFMRPKAEWKLYGNQTSVQQQHATIFYQGSHWTSYSHRLSWHRMITIPLNPMSRCWGLTEWFLGVKWILRLYLIVQTSSTASLPLSVCCSGYMMLTYTPPCWDAPVDTELSLYIIGHHSVFVSFTEGQMVVCYWHRAHRYIIQTSWNWEKYMWHKHVLLH